jgi:D-tyrosyl-tRNA(Tyr) deacylase
MKVVIQLVKQATLSIANQDHASIAKGMVCFVGFTHQDDATIIETMIQKMLNLRIFPDAAGKTNLAISDVAGQILVVPNFTLYADVRSSRRPSFVEAAKPDIAQGFFNLLKTRLSSLHPSTQYGVFGADMSILVHNQGPFTLILDSNEQ